MSEKLLEIDNLSVCFHLPEGVARAVDRLSLNIAKGETLGLVGESGCGKSVTSMSIMGLIASPPGRIESGRILFQGKNLLELNRENLRRIRGKEISMIFQEPMTSLNPLYRIGNQLEEPLRQHSKIAKGLARKRAVELLDHVGIPDPDKRVDSFPHELSGGMKQRVMIAMALACKPKLLIADEPTTALDVTIQAQVLRLMSDLQKETGMAILLITHDMGIVNQMADDIAIMYAGRIVEQGTVRDIFRRPKHPYTRGLLASLPGGTPGARLKAIEGTVPRLGQLPPGCAFAPRCPDRMARCDEAPPAVAPVAPGHDVRCYLHDGEGAG